MDMEALREAIRPVAEAEGLRLVVLFGSAARGHPGPPGDLDLAVRTEGELDAVHLTNRLNTVLGRSDVDLADLGRADPVLLLSVAEEGIPVYEAEPGSFVSFQSLAARRFYDTAKFREMERLEIQEFIQRHRSAS